MPLGDQSWREYAHLSNVINVAPKTQALALNTLSFMYKYVLKNELTLELNFNKSHIQQNFGVGKRRPRMMNRPI